MSTQNKFDNASKTKTGIDVRNVKFNSMSNTYLGQVWDEKSYREDKWTTSQWTKAGKCINKNRPELDLQSN